MILAIILITPFVSFADIESEFQISAPTSRLPLNFEHKSHYETVHFPISNSGLQATIEPSELNLQLSNLQYSADTGLLSVTADQVAASFYSPKISAKGTIQIRQSGFVLNVNIDSYCEGIRIIQPRAKFHMSVNESLQLIETSVDWSNSDWNLELGNCVAPQGTQDLIRTEFLNYFSNTSYVKQLFEAEFRTQFAKILNSKIDELKNVTFSFSDRYQLKTNQHYLIQFQNQNIILRSTFTQASILQNQFYNLDMSNIDPSKVSQKNSIHIQVPKKYFESQIQNELTTSVENRPFRLNDNPSFQKLMNSRFLQFFVWSALMKIPKKSEMTVKSKITPLVDLYQQGDQIKLATSANLTSTIYQSHKGVTNPFVNFSSQLNAEMDLILSSSEQVSTKTNSASMIVQTKNIPKKIRKEFQNFVTNQIQNNSFNIDIKNSYLSSESLKVIKMQIEDQDLVFEVSN